MDEFALRAFTCTADFSSLSKAALFLRVSQPAVSRSIRNLEGSLNTTLLVRHGRGVTLTTVDAAIGRFAEVIREFPRIA